MAEAVWSRFEQMDVCIMAAAVCDFRPKKTATGKIKKGSSAVCGTGADARYFSRSCDARKKSQVLVGFAGGDQRSRNQCAEKLVRKGLDFIVANDASAFGRGDESRRFHRR